MPALTGAFIMSPKLMTKRGYHQVAENAGKIYDKITGPNGMKTAEYLKVLAQETKVCPVVQTLKQ
jgi:hypothetical protein